MSGMLWLPKRLVTSLTRKLDIGPNMQDSCGASESLPTYPMVLEGVKRIPLDPSGPPAAVSRRHLERELLTVTGIGSRVDGLWGLYQNTCKDDFDGPNETLLWPRRGGGSLQGQMASWVPQNASSGSCEELGISISAPPRASPTRLGGNTEQGFG